MADGMTRSARAPGAPELRGTWRRQPAGRGLLMVLGMRGPWLRLAQRGKQQQGGHLGAGASRPLWEGFPG